MADRYAGYIRKSRLRAGERTTSPEEQRAEITRWLADNAPGAIIAWYEDIDQSGRTEDRPAWQQLLRALAGDPPLRGVIVYNYTKTHRDVRGFLAFYDEHLAPRGQRLIDITNPHLNLGSADGRMQGTIFAAVAEHHARKTSELMTATLRGIRWRDGRHLGRAPFGAERDPDTLHLIPATRLYLLRGNRAIRWAADPPPEWEPRRYYHSLRALYHTYAERDLSYSYAAQHLNTAGWRAWQNDSITPTPWTSRSVARVVQQSHLYAGGPQPAGWLAQHAPLLDPDLCARVAARVASRTQVRDPRHKPGRLYLLTGLLYCAECGGRLSGHTSHRGSARYVYYSHTYRNPGCAQGVFPAGALEAEALARLNALPLFSDPALWSLLTALADQPPDTPAPSRLAQAQAELERLIDLHVAGYITQPQFARRLEPLQAEIERLQVGQPLTNSVDMLVEIEDLLGQSSPAAQRDLLRACVQRIEVRDRQIIAMEYAPWLAGLQLPR